MSSWLSYFTGRRPAPTRDATREAIVDLRQHLLTLEKKEDYLTKKIADEVLKAKNALSEGGTAGKRTAESAVKQKLLYQTERDKIRGMHSTITIQVS